MTTLFIDKRNLQLKVDSEALIFYDSNTAEKLGTVPIRLLERVCIHGDLQLSASVLGRLGQHGIGLLVLNGRKKEPVLMMPNLQVDAKRRAAQFGATTDQTFCLAQAKYWIHGKVNNQFSIVQQAAEKKSPPASTCGNLAKHTDKYCRLP